MAFRLRVEKRSMDCRGAMGCYSGCGCYARDVATEHFDTRQAAIAAIPATKAMYPDDPSRATFYRVYLEKRHIVTEYRSETVNGLSRTY